MLDIFAAYAVIFPRLCFPHGQRSSAAVMRRSAAPARIAVTEGMPLKTATPISGSGKLARLAAIQLMDEDK